jgi:hypothetical protein
MKALSLRCLLGLAATLVTAAAADTSDSLAYAPAPPGNPLKGFVPYQRADTTFPHSLEWDYTRLSDVMTGPDPLRLDAV